MAERNLDDLRTVTNVTEQIPDQVGGILADAGQEVLRQSQEAKINELSAKAQSDVSALTNQYQTDNQSDPFGNINNLRDQRNQVLQQYGKQISPIYRDEWNKVSQKISAGDDAVNEAWGFKQSKENIVTSINSSLRDNLTLASQQGSQYGKNGGDLAALLNFEQAKSQLADFSTRNLGEEETKKVLFNFDRDYAKSFVAGVAEVSPERAGQIMQDNLITDKFSPQDRDEMSLLIQRTKRMQDLNQSLTMTGGGSKATDIVNDASMSYFDKRLKIDQLEMSGALNSKTAANARRVLTSQKNVDSVTDTPVMSDIIDRVYDLNTQAGLNNSDYLKGVQNIQTDILNHQADGSLSVIDAQKLNRQMSTLTSKRVADATKSVGNDFYEANQLFNSLAPEQRGEATRQLFYSTSDQNLTPDQMKIKAQGVLDDINQKNRAKAHKVIAATANPVVTADDEAFVKSRGYSSKDVTETAQKYGISEAAVIKKLRAGK